MSHLSRKSEDVVVTIIKILKGSNQQNYQILIKCLSGNPVVKSRCCNMLGNLMRYNDAFYDVLKKNKQIFDLLVRCSQLDELNVRKVTILRFAGLHSSAEPSVSDLVFQSAVFAIGNSIFYNDSLYAYVEEVLSILVNLLNDSLAKTRLHSIAAIGNLANHKISDKMLSLKAPQKLLEVACHDTQFTVQEKALNVLNIFVHNEKAKKVSFD